MFLMAQGVENQKEAGLTFRSLNGFGFTYRTGTNEALWRFSSVFLSGNNQKNESDSLVSEIKDFTFGLQLGREIRKPLSDNFELRYGLDLALRYSTRSNDFDDLSISDYDRFTEDKLYSAGINLILGINYKISENFIGGVEVSPDIYYQTGKRYESIYYINDGDEIVYDISGFNYGFSSSSVLLSIVYRF